MVIAPFLSVRGVTLCFVCDFDLAYEKNDVRSCFMFQPFSFQSFLLIFLLNFLVNIFNAFL